MSAGEQHTIITAPTVPDFDRVYAADPDPWQVASGRYETRKREIVLALLSRRHYRHAWDPACGTGHLAARLAENSEFVLATDGSSRAVDLTRKLCNPWTSVSVEQLLLPAEPVRPAGGFDLIVLAEFFYYLDAESRRAAMETVRRCAGPGCELLAVHWRHRPHDGWLSGSAAQIEIGTDLTKAGWNSGPHLDDLDFVIDSWHRPGGHS